ncbi:exodeoxyribonuclease V subunit beta [Geoalkalibacter sp.]|uniref:exodeoxyribonuclease V subunit beta n=1 Tax=Geoalkalibacter sp. TaxID=3041440 RepID=UPI00272EA7F4|nr:exodeoxyribonuclease V subunit beta [Geoalkalibacter sp.]
MSLAPVEFNLLTSPLRGRNLIEASAGTGKTFTIAAIYLRLVVEQGLSVDQILVVTFTEAATRELRDRLRQRLRGAFEVFRGGPTTDPLLTGLLTASPDAARDRERLRTALACFDEAAIFTIHGFCQRVLVEKAFESGGLFDTELVTDQEQLLGEIIDDFWRQRFIESEPHWLRWSQAKGASPAKLHGFARKHAKAADLRVIPREAPPEDEGRTLCRVLDAYAAAAALWAEEGAQVMSLLQDSPALNRKSYALNSLPRWEAELTLWFAADDPLFPPKNFERFTHERLAAAVKKGHSPLQHPFFDSCDDLAAALEELFELWRLRLIALKAELLDWLSAELPRRKRRQNLRAFDDLLLDLRAALLRPEGAPLAAELRRRFPAALIDEFQDTDPVQYAIFRAIYPHAEQTLFLIGDPKQAIYSFRGADIFAYLAAARDVDRRYTLNTNWRSDGPLVRAVNQVFARAQRPFLFDAIPFVEVHPAPEREDCALVRDGQRETAPLHLWFLPRGEEPRITIEHAESHLAQAVAGEILRLLEAADAGQLRLDDRPLAPGDLAVLVRTNAQARLMQQALRARRVPSVLYSSESLFDAREMEELRLVLTAIADPADDGALRAALATEMLGFDACALEEAAADEGRWESLVEGMAAYQDLWARRGFMAMAATLLGREEVRARLLAYEDGERRLTNLLHGIEVLHQAALENRLGMEGLLAWLAARLVEKPLHDEYQMRLETDENAVKLVTIHRSKGLEYPVVFCPFTWNGARLKGPEVSFHDPAQALDLTLDLGSPHHAAHKALAEDEALAENLRLLYVALTRARHRCILVWGGINQSETSAPAYLLHGSASESQDAGVVDSLAARVKDLDDAQLRARLADLAERGAGCIHVQDVPPVEERVWAPRLSLPAAPRCRAFSGRIAADWRIASFSSLAAGHSAALDLPDHDFLQPAASLPPAPAPRPEMSDILDFPRGARAGSCLHAIFEDLDFGGVATPQARELVARKLRAHGFDEDWTAAVQAMAARVVATPLAGAFGSLRLAEVGRAERLAEMEFHFPVARLTAPDLRALFARQGLPAYPLEAEQLLSHLDFTPLSGFVKGYIDLVFRRDGRYYLLDWKSNHLGGQRGDYHQAALALAMASEAYVLQYHLYGLALHRWLRARLPGYAYEEHFGGVFYLFLRGIGPEAAPGSGIFYDRPTPRLMNELDALLGEKS